MKLWHFYAWALVEFAAGAIFALSILNLTHACN